RKIGMGEFRHYQNS
ncbi:hypothetical protein TNIN_473991, partial [Trichonephila inaurata madagascariensis]